ncbi:unnamed protein product [Rhizoctonia solani]|uniref:Uncharacterized protein n=1 Tax=Rhizoctonia solani TaxID=456999 RepID=A0A8H2Y1V2_9AGAM|nr:unnamed protein product [Rhizoctonia solani]
MLQVCRQLCEIIKSSLFLQYILTLDKSGYQLPFYPRVDLDYAQMIQVLRDNHDGWRSLNKLSNPSFIDIVSHDVGYRPFVDGVFAYTPRKYPDDTPDEPITTIHFHQLPSINKGTEYRYWNHSLNWNVFDVVIQPEIDLLALLTYNCLPSDKQSYHIHLRTMSTNDPHPLAALHALPLPFLDSSDVTPNQLIMQDGLLSIHGRMIGLHLREGGSALGPLTMIWDWMAGTKVAHLVFPSSTLYFIRFISEEYFIVSRSPEPDESHRYKKLGCLEVYPLPLDRDYMRPFARLMLPESSKRLDFVFLGIDGNIPAPSTRTTRPHSKPSIYASTSENGQLCVMISVEAEGYACGWLCVSTKALLKFLHEANAPNPGPLEHSEPLEISWSTWGGYASWIPHFGSETHAPFILGQRCAALRVDHTIIKGHKVYSKDLYVIDFDQNRSKDNPLSETSGQVVSSEPTFPNRPREAHESPGNVALGDRIAQIMFREAFHSDARYSKINVTLEETEELLREKGLDDADTEDDYDSILSQCLQEVMIDDEHVVLVVSKEYDYAPAGILVYNV